MNTDAALPNGPTGEESRDAIEPLEGEAGIPSVTQATTSSASWKGIFAVGLLLFSLIAVSAAALNRAISGAKRSDLDATPMGERPVAAANEPKRLEMALAAGGPASSPTKLIPAIVPIPADVEAPPIGVRRTGAAPAVPAAPQRIAPEDAPVLVVSSRPAPGSPATVAPGDASEPSPKEDPLLATSRNLEAYQRHLQDLLDTLSHQATSSHAPGLQPQASSPRTTTSSTLAETTSGLFGGELRSSFTPTVDARRFHARSLTLPKGTTFTCALRTRIISAASGMVGCQVQRNIYSDDGRVLLIERGSQMDGEYRVASVRPGTVRIPVLWTRVRTPNGVTVDLDSPATGPLGESGVEGFVDNRWGERIGAAMLLSLIDDAVKLTVRTQGEDRQANTIVLPSTTSNTSKLAENVLDSTINIPPLIYQNQGGIVGIYVAHDVDFSSVYELKAAPR